MQRLGQHFLKDERVLERIAETIGASRADTIIEIGPGHGELTQYILKLAPKIFIAIERDENLADELKKTLPSAEILCGDALKILPEIPRAHHLSPKTFSIVGNIPYYITGKLLRIIGELNEKPKNVVLLVQKEVAERLTANPPEMNLLSASVRFWGEPKIIKSVSRDAFRPRPKVESAIIQIVPHETEKTEAESQKYYGFIKMLFKQPRKTVLNNLADGSGRAKTDIEKFLKSQGVEPKLRPQNLDIDTINILSQSF